MKRMIVLTVIIAALSMCSCSAMPPAQAVPGPADDAAYSEEKAPEGTEKEPAQSEEIKDTEQAPEPKDDSKDKAETVTDDTAEQKPSKEEMTEELRKIFIEKGKVSEAEIRMFRADDFDANGEYEAFVLTGSEPDREMYEQGTVEGSIWFVTKEGCEKILDSNGYGFMMGERQLSFGDKKIVLFDDTFTTGVMTYALTVDGGKVSETDFSRCGQVADQDDDEHFSIVDSSYDAVYDPEIIDKLGHTWKSYYFRYDPERDCVREYGGKNITPETAEKLSGRDLVAECLQDGDELDGILYRENGLFHINYSRPSENGCIDYLHRTWDSRQGVYIDDWTEQTGEECFGTYLPALCPDIADYPEM